MAKPPRAVRTILEGNAYQLAFRIAQSLERTLVTRAIESAVRRADASGEVSVTAEHVKRVLDASLLEEACSQIDIILDDKAKVLRRKTLTG